MRIGVLSDTHGWLHPSIPGYFAECDEIWHAGDIGHIEVAEGLSALKPLRAVYGNIDGNTVRVAYNDTVIFKAEELNVLMTHIGGRPGSYDARALKKIRELKPAIFVCGHSHITRVMYDRDNELLYINPGAAGYYGFHTIMTLVRFSVSGSAIHDMEVIELGSRGRVEKVY